MNITQTIFMLKQFRKNPLLRKSIGKFWSLTAFFFVILLTLKGILPKFYKTVFDTLKWDAHIPFLLVSLGFGLLIWKTFKTNQKPGIIHWRPEDSLIFACLIHCIFYFLGKPIILFLLFLPRLTLGIYFLFPKTVSTLEIGNSLIIIYLTLLSCIYLLVKSVYWYEDLRAINSIKRSTKDKKSTLSEDKPIGENGEDILGYNSYAQLWGNKILDSNFDKSFAIGINGKWGSGKTSFIDLLKRTVKADDIIEINFNPWNSQSPQAITKDFFDSFNEKIHPYLPSISRLSNEYVAKLVKLESNLLTRSIQLITSSIANSKPTNNLYIQIDKALKQLNKKVVIYIDDLDRLDSNEIVEVLRLIRNTANFYNTIFVVAYDRNYIVNALSRHNSFGEIEFLEKIFQIEITLPKFNKEVLRNELAKKLRKNFPKANLETITQTIIGSATSKPLLLDSWLETLRDVTRLANSITINYSKLVDEVLFSELLLIEILRLKYPSVYELLKQHKTDYLHSKYDQPTNKAYSILTTRKIKEKEPELNNNSKSSLEEYLLKEPQKHSIQNGNITKVIDLLSALFPDINHFLLDKRDQLSITNPLKYDRYFEYGLSQGNLSENKFKQALNLEQDEFHRKISEWVKVGLASELKNRFYDITIFDSREDFEKIIRAIFHLAIFPTRNTNMVSANIVNFDSDNLLKKLDNYEGSIIKKYYPEKDGKNQLEKFIESLFINAPSPYTFEAQILNRINTSYRDVYPISEKLSHELVIGYLRKYCHETSTLDGHIWNLFHKCKYKERNDINSNNIIPQEAKEIVKDFFLNKDLDGFLQEIVSQNHFDIETFTLSSMVEVIFDKWENFEKELNKKHESQYKNLEEFNRFYKLYAASNHTQAVKFDFQKITVSN